MADDWKPARGAGSLDNAKGLANHFLHREDAGPIERAVADISRRHFEGVATENEKLVVKEIGQILDALAAKEPRNEGMNDGFECLYCGAPEETPHETTCPWQRARDLVDGKTFGLRVGDPRLLKLR